MILWPESYGLPQDHCASVLAGEYFVPIEVSQPLILDIGANVGAFARWAKNQWPDSKIHSYEPHPTNYGLLMRTIADFELRDIFPNNVAVADRSGKFDIHHNGFNCGEWSLAINAATHGEPIQVNCVDAAELPDADIIKLDTEGAEPMILARLAQLGRLDRPQAIMLEYHSASVVQMLKDGLGKFGFRNIAHQEYMPNRGVLKFTR